MSALSPAWYLRIIGGSDYIAGADGSEIAYRPDSYNDATFVFPDAAGTYTNAFTEEQQVELYIGDPAGSGVKMLTGFIDEIISRRKPDRDREIIAHVVDWGAYMAAKRIFEFTFVKGRSPSAVLPTASIISQTLSSVTDGTNTLSGNNLNAVSGAVKQQFEGTQVKDIWHQMAEQYNADYFVDEDRDIHFFESGSKLLQIGGTTYRIQDTPSAAASQIMVDHKKLYEFNNNRVNSFRTVKMVSGLKEAFPSIGDLDKFQVDDYFDEKTLGKRFSRYYIMGTFSDYNVTTIGNAFNPANFISEEVIDTTTGRSTPVIRLNVASASQNIGIQIIGHDDTTVSSFGLTLNEWEELTFWIKNDLLRSSGSITSVKLQLFQDGTNYFEREISSYITGAHAAAWKYFRYKLPSTTTVTETYSGINWTKVGNPTKINFIFLEFTPATGYTVNSGVKFSQFFFYRRKNKTIANAGNPPTEKVVVYKTVNNLNQLEEFAAVEAFRANRNYKAAQCTIPGNTNFKRPAYSVEVDFSTTLGTGRSALSPNFLRISNIRHYLEDGVHYTDLNFNFPFDRP